MTNAYANIPAELRALNQWVVWVNEKAGENDKPRKTPYIPGTTRKASTTNAATWRSFAEALTDYQNGKRNGIGFVFTANDPYFGVDLDHCFENGSPKAAALEVVTALDSFTEISQSGAGLHIIARGKLPSGPRQNKNGDLEIESYETGRYFAMTGNILPSAPAAINERQAQLTAFYQRYLKLPTPTTPNGNGQHPKDKYAAAALANEAANVRQAREGERNRILNKAAFALGQLVGAGALPRAVVESELTAAALAVGLTESEIKAPLRSALNKGMSEPRAIPDRAPAHGNGATELDEHIPQPRYVVRGGAFYSVEQARDGNTYYKRLCNFTARIISEVEFDNGQDHVRRMVITGVSDLGRPFPQCEVNSAAFGAMGWVMEHWGVKAVVVAGQSTKDKLREAIQEGSRDCNTARVYGHTGWRKIDGKRVYLHNGGALGMEGVSVQLDGRLAQYTLPQDLSKANLRAAMTASLNTMSVAKWSVAFPLWGAMFLAPLSELMEPDFTLFPYGQSGALKSSFTAKMLCHFGNFTYKTLPESWESTANILLKHCFVVKDAPIVIDDYAPQASAVDSAKMESKANTVLRLAGNRSARNRMAADTSDRPGYNARGVLISTGEHLPTAGTDSIVARLMPLEFLIDENRQPVTVNAAKLKTIQNAAHDELLQQAMAGYILWLGEQWDTLKKELPQRLDTLRDEMAGSVHLRTPAMFAQMLLGVHLGLTYAQTVGALTAEKAAKTFDLAKETMKKLAEVQASHVQAERPSVQFLNTISELLTQGKAYLVPVGEGPTESKRGEFLGWMGDGFVNLLSGAAHRLVAKQCHEAGIPFSVKPQSLHKMLETEGHLLTGTESGRRTAKERGERVIRLKQASLPQQTGT